MEDIPRLTLAGGQIPSTSMAAAGQRSGPFVDIVEHTIDSKARLSLPAAVRPPFVDGGLLVPWGGPCIALFTDAGFQRWIDHLKVTIPGAGYDNPVGHLRYAHSQASHFKPDDQGRFLLNDRLRFAAGIDRNVTVLGAGSRVELWNPATYGLDLDEYNQNIRFQQDRFDLLPDGSL